jgi:Protein of unknown function (DUF3631)
VIVLDDHEHFLHRFVVLSETQAVAVVLWIGHTHAIEAFDTTGYLGVTSAAKRSGKSRLFEVLELLAHSPLSAVNMSDAVLFRAIEKLTPTLLIDEADAIFGSKSREREEFRGMLNAGWRRGAKAYRMGGANARRLDDFSVFCPKAFAGIGNYLPDTLADRTIRIRLERRTREEPIERFHRRDVVPTAAMLRDRLADWIEPQIDWLRDARPELPDELDDRAWDYWEPLFAIAELAGGDWPQRARAAAIELSGDEVREDESLGVRLLTDLHHVFETSDYDSFRTSALIDELAAIEEAPWGDWYGKKISPQALSALLRPYRIRTKAVWVDGGKRRGYKRDQFAEAWERYIPRVQGGRGGRGGRSGFPSQAAPITPTAPTAPHASNLETIVTSNGDQPDFPRTEEWLARDGVWRPIETDPPIFPNEIVDRREA